VTQANSYSKGACQHCGGHVEFPTAAAGQTIRCPHCGLETLLGVSQGASVEVGGGAAARRRVCLFFGLVAALVAAAGVGAYFYLRQGSAPIPEPATPPSHPANATNAAGLGGAPSNIKEQK
jgi:DNA-directed RNA polymerase subunit RPC12/RpoP